MKRLLVPTLVLAAVLGLGMGADTELISIRAYPSIVNTGAGQRVIVSGELTPAKANESVTVQGKECGVPGAFFRGLWGASTNEGGGWEAEFYVRTKTVLRAVSGDDVSPVLTVQVRAPVHLAPMPGTPGRFRVSAWAFGIVFRGKQVLIKRFDPSARRWRSVLSLVLDDNSSREGFRIPVRKGTTVRAHLPLSQAKPCFLGGYSKLIRT